MKTFALALCFLIVSSTALAQEAQEGMRLRVQVTLVEVNVAVTDSKGNYVRDLKPEDFVILEDNIKEKLATFEEGSDGPRIMLNQASGSGVSADGKPVAGEKIGAARESNLFILFDTSNYMYRGFVFAQDSIADFVRSLEGVDKLALYSYSRDLSRVTPLTTDRMKVLHGVRDTVAGDDAALYNGLLMTVKDAAPLSGRKAVVVFSNGPDNASLVPPEDIAELAQSTGTIIYMISTRQAQTEPISSAVFERLTKTTGGKVYFAKDWKDERQAFASIRDDLGHLYSLSYYPQINPNQGFRKITVKLVGKDMQKYHVRTREGYRVLRTSEQPATNPLAEADSSPQQ
jgi:Ca-activated chloride channel family protein